MEKGKGQNARQEAVAFAVALAAIASIIFIAAHVFGAVTVIGPSMEPAIRGGSVVLVSKTGENDEIKRGDVVVATIEDPKTGESIRVVKRAVGIPGDAVEIRGGILYINGERKNTIEKIREPGRAGEKITLGEDEYFLLGDNVNASGDSRMFGPVKRARIEGICTSRIF